MLSLEGVLGAYPHLKSSLRDMPTYIGITITFQFKTVYSSEWTYDYYDEKKMNRWIQQGALIPKAGDTALW